MFCCTALRLSIFRWKKATNLRNRESVHAPQIQPQNFADYYFLFREHYISFPAVPKGKYTMILICFFFETINVSMVAYNRVTLSSPITFIDMSFWVFGISSCMDGVHILIHGNRAYKITLVDVAAILMGACFAAVLVMRIIHQFGIVPEASVMNLELIYDVVFILVFLSRPLTVYSCPVSLTLIGTGVDSECNALKNLVEKLSSSFPRICEWPCC